MHVKYIRILPKKNKQKARIWPERYKNLSEDEKQKLVEYRKRYYEMGKINEKLLSKVLVSSYKCKSEVTLVFSL